MAVKDDLPPSRLDLHVVNHRTPPLVPLRCAVPTIDKGYFSLQLLSNGSGCGGGLTVRQVGKEPY